MEYDLLRQWQAFADLMNPASRARPTPDATPGFAPFIDAAERFTGAARAFLDGTAKASAPAAAEAARTFSDFLREQFSDFPLPWISSFGTGAAPPSSADSPALGPNREHQQRWQRTAEAWRRMNDAQHRLQRLWSDALREAAAGFAAKSGQLPATAGGADALRKLYDAWIDCAEDAYARTAHGEAFRSALTEFVNAGSEWRGELQTSVEHWAKQLDLPTRSEINSLNTRLKAVETQLRAARKERKPPSAARGEKRPRRKAKR
jgi:Poly(R)-hydroxyalkanoic acid synthase subunit (PHA_synth_III_E)